MNRTLAIVVTYNRKELLYECLAALSDQTDSDFDVLVLDNGSTDGTVDIVRQYTLQFNFSTGNTEVSAHKRLLYRNTGKNLGGAGGFCYALRAAAKLSYDMVWLMDDDTLPEPNAFRELKAADRLLEGNYSFLSGLVRWTDGSPCIMNLCEMNSSVPFNPLLTTEGIFPVRRASFVSLLIPMSCILTAGLPIREFFLYADDVEYTGRLSRLSPGYLVSESISVHKLSANAGVDPSNTPPEKIKRGFYDSRNRFFIAKRSGLHGILSYLYHQGLFALRILIRSKDHRKERLTVLLSGTLAGLLFHPKIEYLPDSGKSES